MSILAGVPTLTPGTTMSMVCGPVLANTVYSDKMLVARNAEVTLPEVAPQTIEIEALGTCTLPMWHRLEDMEFKIVKIGADEGLGAMLGGRKLSIEVRWVQQGVMPDGEMIEFGCKAFVSGIPKIVPGSEIKPGETIENEMTYAATRYQLFVNEEELVCIDRFANMCRIAGVDYAKDIEKFL